jgi:hypothetical protein
MTCKEIEPLIYLVREGELTEEEQVVVNEHLRTCASCRYLADSVRNMTEQLSNAEFNSGFYTESEMIDRVVHAPNRRIQGVAFSDTWKGVAASLLLLILIGFGYQETTFYRQRELLVIRFRKIEQSAEAPGTGSACIRKLERMFQSGTPAIFPAIDSRTINLISEEDLTQFIRQRCGVNAADEHTIRKLWAKTRLIKAKADIGPQN